MKEPLKEVPIELIKRLNWVEKFATTANTPYADALRDLIEDWKRLKESNEIMSQDIVNLEEDIAELQFRLDERQTDCDRRLDYMSSKLAEYETSEQINSSSGSNIS